MIIALLAAFNSPRIIVDPQRFRGKQVLSQSSENSIVVGMTEVSSDGTIYVSSQQVANEMRTYHYAGKNTNVMICDQTGEQIATPTTNRG